MHHTLPLHTKTLLKFTPTPKHSYTQWYDYRATVAIGKVLVEYRQISRFRGFRGLYPQNY